MALLPSKTVFIARPHPQLHPPITEFFMALTVLEVKNAKHSGGASATKLNDGEGLWLLISKTNKKRWMLRFTYKNQRPEMGLGVYPEISLARARELAFKARSLVSEGIDPRAERRAARDELKHTFEPIALEWWDKQSSTWSDEYAERVKRWLSKDVFPLIGKLPIADVDQGHITEIMLGIEKAGHPTSAAPTLSTINRIFGHALAHRLTKTNPAQGFPLKDIIKPLPKVKHRAAITDPKQLGQLMRDIKSFDKADYCTFQALRLVPFLFLRPKEVRKLKWEYVDFDTGLITIPDESMKKDRVHIVPMAKQVIIQLQEAHAMTGYSPYVFPNIRNGQRYMSKNVINDALRKMGYGSDVVCGHGFRATASTLLTAQEWKHEVIETQLAHLVGTATSRAYNHYQYIKERTKMMQSWADYLDALRDGAKVISISIDAA